MEEIFQENEFTEKLAKNTSNILQIDAQGKLHIDASIVEQITKENFNAVELTESQKKGLKAVIEDFNVIPKALTDLSDFPHSLKEFSGQVVVVGDDENTLVFKSIEELIRNIGVLPVIRVNSQVAPVNKDYEIDIKTVSDSPANFIKADEKGAAFLDLTDTAVLETILRNLDFSKLTDLQKAELKEALK